MWLLNYNVKILVLYDKISLSFIFGAYFGLRLVNGTIIIIICRINDKRIHLVVIRYITESCFRHRKSRKVEVFDLIIVKKLSTFRPKTAKVEKLKTFLVRPHYNVCLSAPNDVGADVDSVA